LRWVFFETHLDYFFYVQGNTLVDLGAGLFDALKYLKVVGPNKWHGIVIKLVDHYTECPNVTLFRIAA
jgi:hypothetical protein